MGHEEIESEISIKHHSETELVNNRKTWIGRGVRRKVLFPE